MDEKDLIIGLHSIVEAINNPQRTGFELFATDLAYKDISKLVERSVLDKMVVRKVSSHKIQEEGERFCKQLGHTYQRIPSQTFLLADPIAVQGVAWLYDKIESSSSLKLFCLDQVTDVHNAGAILRTCSFYGVDALIIANKGNFGPSPGLFRLASGAAEHLPMVRCSHLPRLITKLQEKDVRCIGFSEHEKHGKEGAVGSDTQKSCLIMGAEDRGLSHAVLRILDETISLKTQGCIKSLNVSVAAAIAMERFFLKN